jgi:hypothetical protein
MGVDGAAAAAPANGNGVCGHSSAADVLMSKIDAVLDDRWVPHDKGSSVAGRVGGLGFRCWGRVEG